MVFKQRRDAFLQSGVVSSGTAFFTAQFAANMVRTKADSVPASYRKAVAASAPRKSLGSSSANASSASGSHSSTPAKGKYAGGNPVCPRPTPTWQKGIGDFFGGPPRKPEKENLKPTESDEEEAGGSGMSKASRKSRPLPAEEEDD